MMGGQNGIAELIWFVRWLEIALGAIKTTAGGEDVWCNGDFGPAST